MLCGCGPNDDISFESSEDAVSEEESTTTIEAAQTSVYVYICGEVVSPGVYEFKEGSRVYEAIEAAGGLTENADASRLNQAQLLSDGQQITVYSLSASSEAEAASTGSGKININYATLEELTQLPGIGESRASDIITYREENGFFRTIEDIQNVSGIKDKTFEKLEDLIEV